jgi:ATPase subunit of ABC transporter with duplicated ATPase domains
MPEFIYTMKGVGKIVPPKRQILKDIWLSFYHGAKIGVLGLNGAGKSSLLKIMAGLDTEIEGEAFPGKNIRVGHLEAKGWLDRFNEISDSFAEPMEPDAMEKLLAEQAQLQDKIDASGAWELESKLEIAMDALRCPPPDSEVTHLSGGERRRVALCRLLLQQPDLLLLDEPTNHLDAESVAWLERHLKDYPGTVVAITHDRYFLDNVAGWILELDRGEGIPWEGNYSSWLDQKKQRLDQEEKASGARQKTLERELEWVRMSPRARQAKSKARLKAYETLYSESAEKRPETVQIYIPPGPRLGDLVVEAQDLSKGYGERLLFEKLSFRLPPGGIVGIIGPNGAGKTTLFRMITGQEQADSGTLRLGETVELAYVDQSRDELNSDHNVWQAVSEGLDTIDLGKRQVNSRARFPVANATACTSRVC